jgi:hypothetical protein
VKISDLLEDALRINSGGLMREDVQISREYERGLSHKLVVLSSPRSSRAGCQPQS